MDKEVIIKKIEDTNFKKRSFPERVCKLILEGEFDKPLISQKFIDMYNDGPKKNIRVVNLTALFQPLLSKEIVKTKTLKEGKKKIKLWFPAWIDGKVLNKTFDTKLTLKEEVIIKFPKDIKEIILDDVGEINRCFGVEAWKSICMLAGRIIESSLLYYIELFDKINPGNNKIRNITGKIQRHQQIGYDLITEVSQGIGLIKESEFTKNFSDLIISCRHPSVHFRGKKIVLNEKKIATIINSIEIIFEDTYKNAKQLSLIK